jgi:hypothetical protein
MLYLASVYRIKIGQEDNNLHTIVLYTNGVHPAIRLSSQKNGIPPNDRTVVMCVHTIGLYAVSFVLLKHPNVAENLFYMIASTLSNCYNCEWCLLITIIIRAYIFYNTYIQKYSKYICCCQTIFQKWSI